MNHSKVKVYHWREAPPRKSDTEIEEEIAQFVASGGKVSRFRQDTGQYEKAGIKLSKKLGGLVRPFKKEDALIQR